MNKLFSSTFKLLLAASTLGLMPPARAADTNTATSRFGFTGPEIFPIDLMVSLIRAADIDGDGLNDIVIANNSRSKINILFNQTGHTNTMLTRAMKRELNELPPDARFRIESIASEKRIAALVVTDLNGDGRPDVCYYGEPKELVLQYNQGSNNWSAAKRWPIDDGQLQANALATGDLNGDGLTDLALLAENQIHVLFQKADHSLEEPVKQPFSGAVKSIQILDIDGDQRDDLMQVNWESPAPFRYRLQSSGGQLGPEIYFNLPPIRSYNAEPLVRGEKTMVVTVAQKSGRAQISNFTLKPAESIGASFKQGQLSVQPLNKTGKARRGVLWADVNGDGRPDLLVAEPESGQLVLQLQKPDGSLESSRAFPTLTGVADLAAGDWDGDGKTEIFLLSLDERQVGVTRLDDKGRFPFPQIVPLEGKPLSLAVGSLKAGAKPVLVLLTDVDGKRFLITRTADEKSQKQKLADSFKSNPTSLLFHDVDQDGLTDLVIMNSYDKVKILRQTPDKDLDELDVAPPGGTMVDQPWAAVADVDGDGKLELLLAQKNFLRAVVLKKEMDAANDKSTWNFQVREQINGSGSNARLLGVAALPDGTNTVPALFLLDAERKAVTLCLRDASGVWQARRNITLPFSEFTTVQPVALGGNKPNAVALIGLNATATLALQGDVWEISELDSYETPVKDGRLNDLVAGDLDNDGRKDLVFMETARNYVDLVLVEPPGKLVPANRWQVFEERTFRQRASDHLEPREALVTDVTGDKKNDLIVVVHDRILIYPQE